MPCSICRAAMILIRLNTVGIASNVQKYVILCFPLRLKGIFHALFGISMLRCSNLPHPHAADEIIISILFHLINGSNAAVNHTGGRRQNDTH